MTKEFVRVGKKTIVCLITDDDGREYCGSSVKFDPEADDTETQGRARANAEKQRQWILDKMAQRQDEGYGQRRDRDSRGPNGRRYGDNV